MHLGPQYRGFLSFITQIRIRSSLQQNLHHFLVASVDCDVEGGRTGSATESVDVGIFFCEEDESDYVDEAEGGGVVEGSGVNDVFEWHVGDEATDPESVVSTVWEGSGCGILESANRTQVENEEPGSHYHLCFLVIEKTKQI